MKKEEIEKAARYAINEHYNCGMCYERDYCEHCYGSNTAYDCQECGGDEFKEGFMKGAEWRINSVWHSGNEVPKEEKYLVIELDTEFHICIFKDGYNFLGYYDNRGFIAFEVIRWAYLKDLMPNVE